MNTREKPLDIGEKLDGLLLDENGTMCTLLVDRGSEERPYDEANLMHSHVVRDLYEECLRVGTRITEANPLAASHLKLAASNLEERAREINVKEANLTREAVDVLPDEAKDVFAEQAKALLESEADTLLPVTQNRLVEAQPSVGGTYPMSPASMLHLAGDVIEAIGQLLRSALNHLPSDEASVVREEFV